MASRNPSSPLPASLTPRQKRILQLLWPERALSRRDVQRELGVHPNLIGEDIGVLLEQRLVREGDTTANGRGRPGIPLRIDDVSRHVIGIAISPDGVELSKVNLLGHPIGTTQTIQADDAKTLIPRTAAMLRKQISPDTLAVGVSATGVVDPVTHTLVLSSSIPQATGTSLAPLYTAAGDTPVLVQNDMHALAARWLLSDRAASDQDVLLILLEDGRLGSAMLIGGVPNQGCTIGANEIGHSRFPVDTPLCYCGQKGCLERIFSSQQLVKLQPKSPGRSLGDELLHGHKPSKAGEEIEHQLWAGIANAANFVRPHRVVMVGSFSQDDAFFSRFTSGVQSLLLRGLSDRTRIERWTLPAMTWGEVASWVALVDLLDAR